MVLFNDLRISDDRLNIIVDCAIEDIDEYEQMYIHTVKLDFYKNIGVIGVSNEKTLVAFEASTESYYDEYGEEHVVSTFGKRAIRCIVPIARFREVMQLTSFDDSLFVVTVVCDVMQDGDGSDAIVNFTSEEATDYGIILDWKMVYQSGMNYVAKVASQDGSCALPKDFEQFILIWNALRLAISTCDFVQIVKYWELYLKMNRRMRIGSGDCGCNK